MWDTWLDGVAVGMRLGGAGEESEGLREYELFFGTGFWLMKVWRDSSSLLESNMEASPDTRKRQNES